MLKLKTHYEQVPLDIVMKNVEEAIRRQETIEEAKKGKREEDLFGTATLNGKNERA